MRNGFLSFLFFSFFCTTCDTSEPDQASALRADQSNAAKDTPYQLNKPSHTWSLPEKLLEVSGAAWVDKDHLLVVEDSHPVLYLLRLGDEISIEKKFRFAPQEAPKMDFEDLTVDGQTAYALWSDGTLYRIEGWQQKPEVKKWQTDLSQKNDAEGLCLDPVSKNLLVALKNKSGVVDASKTTRAVYMFDHKLEKLQEKPFLLIEQEAIEKVTGERLDFYPSAVAVHPLTNDVYLLSTKGTKALAQYSYKGELKKVNLLDAGLMPQPEGLCFAPDGTLYISTEGKKKQPAKLLQFQMQ
jgi:hypothetical protein